MRTFNRRITIYKTDTGEICRSTECPARDVRLQCGPGEAYIGGLVSYETHFVDLDTRAAVPKPPRPSPHHVFNCALRQWVLSESDAWAAVRADRDRRIAASDWVVLRATDHGAAVQPEWQAYRQALRDITDQPDPLRIVWPAPPG